MNPNTSTPNFQAIARIRDRLESYHRTPDDGLSVKQLASLTGICEREVRKCVEALRMAGQPVCAHPTTGYFWASTPEHIEFYLDHFLLSRAMKSLTQLARVRRVSVPALLGQMQLKLTEPIHHVSHPPSA